MNLELNTLEQSFLRVSILQRIKNIEGLLEIWSNNTEDEIFLIEKYTEEKQMLIILHDKLSN
jgi:hypothetical protein